MSGLNTFSYKLTCTSTQHAPHITYCTWPPLPLPGLSTDLLQYFSLSSKITNLLQTPLDFLQRYAQRKSSVRVGRIRWLSVDLVNNIGRAEIRILLRKFRKQTAWLEMSVKHEVGRGREQRVREGSTHPPFILVHTLRQAGY